MMYEDGQYLANNPTWHEQDSPYKATWIRSLLVREGVDPRRVAEIGCGSGGILRSLAESLPDATFDGFDISPQAVELAGRKSHPRVRIHHGMLPEESTWDLLMAIDVLEHMEDPASFLREMRSRTSLLAVHLPLDISLQTVARLKPLVERRARLGHIHMYVRETARALVEENGWVVVQERYTAGALELPVEPGLGPWVRNRLPRLPRKILFALAPDFTVRLLGGWSILLLCRPRPLSAGTR